MNPRALDKRGCQGELFRRWQGVGWRLRWHIVARNRIVVSPYLFAVVVCAVVCWTLLENVADRSRIFRFGETQVMLTKLGNVGLPKNIKVSNPSPNEQLLLKAADFVQQFWTDSQRRIKCTFRPDECSAVLSGVREIGKAKVGIYALAFVQHAKIGCFNYVGRRTRTRVLEVHDYAGCLSGRSGRQKWFVPLCQIGTTIKDERALESSERFSTKSICHIHRMQDAEVDNYIGEQPAERKTFDNVFLVFKAIVAVCVSLALIFWGWWQVSFGPVNRQSLGAFVCVLAAIPMAYAFWLFVG